MPLPALHSGADTRSITERVNAIIKNIYNLVIPVGADNYVLTSDGTTLAWEALPTAGDARVLQVVNTQTGALATGTTALPADNTIPQSGEGDQYMSLTITPESASSILEIDVVVFGSHSTNSRWQVGLFQDSVANALASGTGSASAATVMGGCAFRHRMTSGTTSATTFKVRAGGAAGATFSFNGESGAGFLGATLASSITITEVL